MKKIHPKLSRRRLLQTGAGLAAVAGLADSAAAAPNAARCGVCKPGKTASSRTGCGRF